MTLFLLLYYVTMAVLVSSLSAKMLKDKKAPAPAALGLLFGIVWPIALPYGLFNAAMDTNGK